MKTIVKHQSETHEIKCNDNSSDDNKKVVMVDFMERHMRPTSNIVLKGSSASDLTPGTAASEAVSEIKIKFQKGYDMQLRSVIRDKIYTRIKFVNSKQLALYVAELGLNTG